MPDDDCIKNLCRQMIKPLVIFLLLSSMWTSPDESTCDGKLTLTCVKIYASIVIISLKYDCSTVSVSSPGKRYTYIPQGSTVYINCTGESGQSPAWSVRLTETAENLHQFGQRSTELLNNRGFYEINLPSDGPNQTVVQLIANSTTHQSDRTLVKCTDVASQENPTLFETTLVIYGRCVIHDKEEYIKRRREHLTALYLPTNTLSVKKIPLCMFSHDDLLIAVQKYSG